MKICSFILCFLFTTNLLAINGKQFFKNVRTNYESIESISLKLNYQLFKGFKGDELIQEYSSNYFRSENRSYRRMGDIELINTDSLSLNVNHENKQIIVSNPSNIEALDFDIVETLKWCKDVQISEGDNFNEVNLILKTQTDIPFSMVKIRVDKNFWIQEVTFLYATQLDFSDSYFSKKMDYPRLVVSYNHLSKNWIDKENIISTAKFIDFSNDKVLAKELYTNYQIIDLRSVN